LWRASDVTDVGLSAEHQDVEVVGVHLSQRALAPAGAQGEAVGDDLFCHG
jgi:hypothetical protein